MDEDKYQLGIRELSKNELVNLVIAYRNELKSCSSLCRGYAEENLAKDALHKVVAARKKARIDALVEDYKLALEEV